MGQDEVGRRGPACKEPHSDTVEEGPLQERTEVPNIETGKKPQKIREKKGPQKKKKNGRVPPTIKLPPRASVKKPKKQTKVRCWETNRPVKAGQQEGRKGGLRYHPKKPRDSGHNKGEYVKQRRQQRGGKGCHLRK